MSPTEKAISNVNERHDKADADRRKLRGDLAVNAWRAIIIADVNCALTAEMVAESAFIYADAMLAKMKAEGAL